MDNAQIHDFREAVQEYYRRHKRSFLWRKTHNPYHILVSEIMLQQTQVGRVEKKYEEFLDRFPDPQALVSAPLSEVLRVWQGLGYNRRAIALKKIAEDICGKYRGIVPENAEILDALPGIGKNTAGSILAFAYNKPVVFIETNIRRAFIHFFFSHRKKVRDEEIVELIGSALDKKNPREWYWALMDYGAMLGRSVAVNPNRKSAHYRKQVPFSNSNREFRGKIIKTFLELSPLSEKELGKLIGIPRRTLRGLLLDLYREGFLFRKKGKYALGMKTKTPAANGMGVKKGRKDFSLAGSDARSA